MLSWREHLAGIVVMGVMLTAAIQLLLFWLRNFWWVAVGLVVLFVPIFIASHAIGCGIVALYERWLEHDA